eukprot:scaffold3587_cov364-Prasinococcus_capsulatus_cf.AAC.10
MVEAEKQKIRKEFERKEQQIDVKKKMCAPRSPACRGCPTTPSRTAPLTHVLMNRCSASTPRSSTRLA